MLYWFFFHMRDLFWYLLFILVLLNFMKMHIVLGPERILLRCSPVFLNRGHCRHLDSTISVLDCIGLAELWVPWLPGIKCQYKSLVIGTFGNVPDVAKHPLGEAVLIFFEKHYCSPKSLGHYFFSIDGGPADKKFYFCFLFFLLFLVYFLSCFLQLYFSILLNL